MERKIHNNKKLGMVLVLISALAYGLMPIFSKFAYDNATEVSTLMFIRFLISTIILWSYIFTKKLNYKVDLKHFFYIVSITIFGYFIASTTIFYAYKIMSVSIATLILFIHPVFVVILEKIVFKLDLSKKKILVLIITAVGLYIVLYTKDNNINILGIVLSFIASISYALYCVGLSEKRTQKLSGIIITAYVTLIVSLTSFLQCMIFNEPLIPNDIISVSSGVALAIISTIIASITFYEGLSIVGASSATLISSFEPVFVILLSTLILNEILKMNVLIGGTIILIAIIILEKNN